ISRIGDNSNLILDPDLDTYYLMSVVILRLPEFVSATVELWHAAQDAQLAAGSPRASEILLLSRGSFAATKNALNSDHTRITAILAQGAALAGIQDTFAAIQRDVVRVEMSWSDPVGPPYQIAVRDMMGETGEYWRQASSELGVLLQRRIESFY